MTKKQRQKGEQYFSCILDTMEKICDSYGYRVCESFGKIYIYTTFESWNFKPDMCGCIKLMHGNGIGNSSTSFHKQFSRRMTPEQIVTYVNEHERAKYRGESINFTFTKTGAYKVA